MDVELDENGQPLKTEGELSKISICGENSLVQNTDKKFTITASSLDVLMKRVGASNNKPFYMLGVGSLNFLQIYQYQIEECMFYFDSIYNTPISLRL